MGTFLQAFGRGHIEREGDKYEYHVKGKKVGTYASVDELVQAQKDNGKQDQQPEPSVQEPVEAKPARKAPAKGKKKQSKASKKSDQ